MATTPRVGEIVDNYRFLGGDPSSKESWESFSSPKQGDILDGYVFNGGDPSNKDSWQTFKEETITDKAKALAKDYLTKPVRDYLSIASNVNNGSVTSGLDGTKGNSQGFDVGAGEQALNNPKQAKQETLKEGSKIVDGIAGVAEVGARKGYAGLGRIEAGAISLAGDILDSDTLRNVSKSQLDYADKIENSAVLRGTKSKTFEPSSGMQELPELSTEAIGSVITSAPAIAAGAGAIPAIFATSALSDYGTSGDQLNVAGKVAHAVGSGAAEALGEKLGGTDKFADALMSALGGKSSLINLGTKLLLSGAKEIPSEEVTTTAQFLLDKNKAFGLNQDATLEDYKNQVIHTAKVAALQGAGMGGAGGVIKAVIGDKEKPVSGVDNIAQPLADTNIQANYEAAQAKARSDAALPKIQEATSLDEAIVYAQEAVNTPINTGLLNPLANSAPEAIDAADILGDENVSDTPNATTELANDTIASASDNTQGSVADLSNQPAGRNDTGGIDNPADTPAQSSGGDQSIVDGNTGNDAVTNAKEGDIVTIGDSQFKKTANGFERVANETPVAETETVESQHEKLTKDGFVEQPLAKNVRTSKVYKKTLPDGSTQIIAINKDTGKVHTDRTVTTDSYTVKDSYLEGDITVDKVSFDNKTGQGFFNVISESNPDGDTYDITPRGMANIKSGMPIDKVIEIEFSNGGAISQDGTKTVSTTTVTKVSPNVDTVNTPAVRVDETEKGVHVGEKINKEWTAFSPESGTLNIPRSEMPQVKAEHRGAMVNFLNARGVDHTQETVPASSLKPTQQEFSEAKVKKASKYVGGDRSILVSADNHVLDGHHQWLSKLNKGDNVDVIRLNAPIAQLLNDVKEFPSSTVESGATTKSQEANQVNYSVVPASLSQKIQSDFGLNKSGRDLAVSSKAIGEKDGMLNFGRDSLHGKYYLSDLNTTLKFDGKGNWETTDGNSSGKYDSNNLELETNRVIKSLLDSGDKVAKESKPKSTKPTKPKTLLATLRELGGVSLSEKRDVTGEDKGFAPGGYNQVFKQASNRSLKGLIESGDLDEYLPYNMRLESNGMNDDAFDSTEAYDYLADKIRNGESVLPYDTQLEIEASRFYENESAQDDIGSIAEISDEEVNKLLQEAGYDERESGTESAYYGSGLDEQEQESTGSNSETENVEQGISDSDAASGEREESAAETNASQQAEVNSAIEKYNLPEGTVFKQGKALAAGKWIAEVNGISGNMEQSIPEAAASLGRFIQNEQDRKNADANRIELSRTVAGKIKRGVQPSDLELEELFGLQNNHDYVKLSNFGWFATDYLGIPRNKIHESLGKAGGISTSNFGAKYKIVYPRKLHEVFGNKEAIKDLLGDNTATKQAIADAERAKDAKRNSGNDNQDTFTLTGSNSEADQAAAAGAQDLFAAPIKQQSNAEASTGADVAENTANQSSNGQANDEVAKAAEALTAAGVKGKEKLDTIKDVREGKVTADEVADAYGEPAAQKPKGNVDDFGEKLEGARKDMVRAMAKEYSDDELASLPLSKIWPITDVNLIENKTAAAIAWTAREEIPSKPRKPYALKVWVGKVKILRDIGRIVSKALEVNPELMLQKLKDAQLGQFKSKVALLEAIDRDAWKRIGKVEEYPNAYSYVDGVKQIKPMVRIDVDGVTTTYEASSVADVIDNVNEKLGKEKQEKRMAFEVRGSSKGGYFINKKGDKNYTKLKTFDSSKEAFEFLRNNYDEVVAAWDATKDRLNVKESDVRGKENRPRTGEDYRKGKDVSPEEFATTFGFRGIQFGEWVKQGGKDNDRQGALNAAYDALMDLANIVGVPPKAMSLEGTLGLSFGARGKGSASAHFEPSNLVINLTKTQGAGTLAHEWFHALDNYFSRKRGGEKSMAEVKSQQAYREGNFITYKPEALYINKNYGNKGITKAELERYRKQSPNSKYWSEENWILDPKHPQGVRPEVEVRFADLVDALNTSPMKQRARSIDGVKEGTDGYWSRIIELGARAFENYVIHKMQLNGYDNDYLANVVRVDSFNRDSSRFPYLLDEEVAPVAEAFDNLFSEIQTKETDSGNVAMFSRSPMKSTDANANRGEASMNQALLNKADVSRAMYHNELGWIDFVWGDDFKGIKHIIKRRMTSDGMTESEVYRLLTKDLVKTIASGEVIRSSETEKSTRLVIRGDDNEAVLVKSKSGNGWVVTGFKLNEQVNQSRGATASDLRSTEPIRSRFSEVAVLDELSTMAKQYVNTDGLPLFNREGSASTGLPKQSVQKAVNTIRTNWKNAPEIIVVQDMNDPAIREAVREENDRQLSQGAEGQPEGFFDDGKVYILASEMNSAADVVRVVFHEALGHYGLRGLYGKELGAILDRIAMLRKNDMAKKAEQYGLDLNKESDKRIIAEEVLAEMAQTAPEAGFVKRAIAAIRKFLRSIGVELELADNDIVANYLIPARNYVQRGGEEQTAANLVAAFNRTDNNQDISFGVKEISDADAKKLVMAWTKIIGELGDTPYRYPVSMETDLDKVAKEVSEGAISITKVRNMSDDNEVTYIVKSELNKNTTYITEKDNEVWINVADSKEGDGGSLLYTIIGNYAANNGKVFIGDPEGITSTAIIRRMVNMASLATKFGTTEFIKPHKEQLEALGKYGLSWKTGDDQFNLAHLLFATYNVTKEQAEGIENVEYNRDTGDFTNIATGEQFTDGDFEKLAQDIRSNVTEGAAGSGTLKVAAAIGSILRESEYGRSQLASSGLGNGATQLRPNRLEKALYSRSKAPQQGRLTPQWADLNESKIDSLIYTLQDKQVDLKRVTQAIKDAGNQIDNRWNAYLQEELYHGRSAKRTQDFIKNDLEPLIEEMRMRGVSMADFEEYLWMRHAEERNIQIATVNPEMPDGGSGVSTQEANNYLANLPPADKSKYEALAKRIDLINRKSRQVLLDYGLEDAATIKAWESAYKNYVPLMREDMDMAFGNGTGQGFSVKGNASKRATGSNRAVVDIIANIAQQYEKNIIRGEKNRVATALIGLAKLNPNESFWQVDTPPTLKTINKATGLVETRTDPNYKNRDNVVVARIRNRLGRIEERSVVFNQFDERAMRMAASIKNLDQDQMGELLGAASSFTRYFASINTQYNPVFGIINITRDVQGALLNLSTTPIANRKAEVLKNTGAALLGIYQDLRSERKTGKPANNKWSALFDEFQREGGQTGYRDMFKNAKERSEALKNALDPTWWQNSKIGKVISLNGAIANQEQWIFDKAIKPIFDWLSDYNNTLENAVRLSVYKSALDNGSTKQEAASLAKNISVNFNRKGEMGRQIGSLYAFFNASVQGSARIGETLARRDANGKYSFSKTGKRIIQGGLLLGSMQALLLAAAGYGDDDPPEFLRNRSLIIPMDWFGLDNKYVTIPMPLGFNAIPAFGRITTEWALSGGEDTQKRVISLMDMLLDVTNPIGNAGLSMQTLAPTLLDPLVALAENKDFTGRPIYREDFNSLNPTAGYTRSKDKAWAVSVEMARFINLMTGGTDYKQGAISPTADQLEYLAGQFTGGVGREIIKAGTTADSLFTGEDLPPYKIPLVGRFYGNASGQASQGAAFYQNVRELNEHEAEIKGRRENGEDVASYIKAYPEARLAKQGDLAMRQVNALRKRQRQLKEGGASRDTIKKIDERITVIMTKFNERIEAKKEARQ